MGLQTGILGLVTFLAMIWIVLTRNRRAFALTDDHDQREALLYLFLLLLGYLSNGYFQPIYSVYPKLNNLF
jgi:integral membrane sensor domain MASE1